VVQKIQSVDFLSESMLKCKFIIFSYLHVRNWINQKTFEVPIILKISGKIVDVIFFIPK
jgi:hypothetical protein